MPSLTPESETTETLSPIAEGSRSLPGLAEVVSTLTALAEVAHNAVTTLGFFPGSTLFGNLTHPFPSNTNYPGDTYVSAATGYVLTPESETSETLTPLSEV